MLKNVQVFAVEDNHLTYDTESMGKKVVPRGMPSSSGSSSPSIDAYKKMCVIKAWLMWVSDGKTVW
jgi:hypothetical protein